MLGIEDFARAVMPGPSSAPTPAARLPTREETCARAWEYESSTARTNVVMCGRRGMKTSTARRRAMRRLGAQAGCRVLYVTLIKENCRKLFFDPVKLALKRKYGWDWEAHGLSLTLSNGSYLEARGVDKVDSLDKLRGDNWAEVFIDEMQANRDDIARTLIKEILRPSLIDQGGTLNLLGSAPPVDDGLFAEYFNNPKYRAFNWSIFANPYLDLEEVLFELSEDGVLSDDRIAYVREKLRGADDAGIRALEDELADLEKDNPIFVREYLGRLVDDPEARAYEFTRERNTYDPAEVNFEAGKWRHALGLDLGFSDNDAIVSGSYRPDDPSRSLYVRFRWQVNHLHVDLLAGVLEAVRRAYPNATPVGDHGGHGAVKVLETLRARLHVQFQAKPPDVMASVGLVNDDFRVKRLLLPSRDVETERVLRAHRELVATGLDYTRRPRLADLDRDVEKLILDGGGADLAGELKKVTKSIHPTTRLVQINKRGFHSDLSEANRYMHHAARHWAARMARPEVNPDDRSPEARAARRERDARERRRREERGLYE